MTNQGIQKVLDQYNAGGTDAGDRHRCYAVRTGKKAGGKRPCGENSIRGSGPEKAGEKE